MEKEFARVIARESEMGIQVRNGMGVGAREGDAGTQRLRRRCVSVAGRSCASGVVGAREMVAAGQTKLMLFAFSHSLRI